MSNFLKTDVNGIVLQEGDYIEIEICAASAFNPNRVVKKGKISWSYIMMAYCLSEENGDLTPLCNFAPYCKFKKI